MKIRLKLTLSMIALSLLVFGSVGVTLLVQARGYIMSFSHERAMATAREYAQMFGGRIMSYWHVAQTTARLMEQYGNVDAADRRDFVNRTLEDILLDSPGVAAIWAVWEPGMPEGAAAPDGMLFAPFVYRSGYDTGLRDFGPAGRAQAYLASARPAAGSLRDPFPSEFGESDLLLAGTTAAIISGGRVVGVVGVEFDTGGLQEMALGLFPFGNGVTKVFTNDGTIVGQHLYPERIGTNILETELDMGGPYMYELTQAVRQGEELYYRHFHPAFQQMMHMFIVPIQIGNADTPWSLALVIPRRSVMDAVYTMESTALVLAIVVLLIIVPIIIFVPRSLTRPIRRLTDILKDISEGDGDLTREIAINSRDEVGNLAHYFSLTLTKIKSVIVNIKRETAELHGMGDELAGNTAEAAAAAGDITEAMRGIKGRVGKQSASVSAANASMQSITGNIGMLNGQVELQTVSVADSSAAVEEMLANISSVTETLLRNAANVGALTAASEAGRTGLRAVVADIEEIARESEGLLKINAVMEDIAGKTSLLSMNAAIEAARAGEAGKGFAVVASEVRKLAESSSEQSKMTSDVLNKIRQAVGKINASTAKVLERFEAIDTGVKTVAEQEEIIRAAMEEQGQGSKRILEAMGQVNDVTGQVKTGSAEMFEGSREVIRESKNMEEATADITEGIDGMTTGTEQVSEKVNRIEELSRRNRENVSSLLREVSRFKVD